MDLVSSLGSGAFPVGRLADNLTSNAHFGYLYRSLVITFPTDRFPTDIDVQVFAVNTSSFL